MIAWPGWQRADVLRLEPQIQQRHAFAGRGKQGPFFGIAQRFDAQRIARDQHVATRIEKHQTVGPVKPTADVAHHVDQIRLRVKRQLAADLVHDDLGVVLAGQMMLAIFQAAGRAAAV